MKGLFSPGGLAHRDFWLGILVFSVCAAVIGCGGGGGGGGGGGNGGNNNNAGNGGNNAGNNGGNGGTSTGSVYPDQVFYGVFDGDGKTVYRSAPDGTNEQMFADLPATIPNAAISDDGSKFAFFVESDSGGNPVYNLYVNTTIVVAGAQRLTPVNGTNDFFDFEFSGSIQFSADGSKIYFTGSTASDGFGIFVVNASGGALSRLADGEEAYLNLANTKLIVTQLIGGAGEIVSMNLDGTGAVNLTNNAAEDFMPQWSKDGLQVVFSSDRNMGQFDVFRMNSGGGSLSAIVSSAQDEYGPSLNNDGDQVAYVILSGDPDVDFGVYRSPVAGGAPVQIKQDSAIDQRVYWTPEAPPAGLRSRMAIGGFQMGRVMRPRLYNR